MHFGFFHFVYLIFVIGIVSRGVGGDRFEAWDADLVDFIWIIAAAVGFHLGTMHSFRKTFESDLQGRLNLEVVILLPNALILPMHLTIIFGVGMGSNRLAVLLFSTLKTGADYLMHIVEHMMLQKKIPKE
jgi:hypothetical protein